MSEEKKAPFAITDELLENTVFDIVRDPIKYPVTNAEFVKSELVQKNDKGFLLGEVKQGEDSVLEWNVEKDMPFVHNNGDEHRYNTYKNSGILLPSNQNMMKQEFHAKTLEKLPEVQTLATVAAGAMILTQSGKIVVTDNSLGKRGSEGNTNFAARGKVSTDFFSTLNNESIEEFSAVEEKDDKVVAYYLTPPHGLPCKSKEENKAYQESLQAKKEETMRRQLRLRGSELADQEWEWVELESTLAETPAAQDVRVNIMGEKTLVKAAATHDPKKGSLNLHVATQTALSDKAQPLVCEYFHPDDLNEIRNSYAITFKELAQDYLAAPKADLPNGIKSALPALKDATKAALALESKNELVQDGKEMTAPQGQVPASSPSLKPQQ